jgi:hypothetical protein
MKYHIFLLIIVLSLVTACGLSAEEQAAMTATASTATAAAWTRTPTVTNTPTLTSTLTSTPTETLTPTPSEAPTETPTITLTPTNTSDPTRYTSPDNTFSFSKLGGWEPQEFGLEYPVLIGPIIEDIALNLVFMQEESTFPLAFYAALSQDSVAESVENLKTIREDFLVTDEGKDYFRWEFTNDQDGVNYHQVFYIFESGDWKLLITYTRPGDQGSEYDSLVDETMATVRFER